MKIPPRSVFTAQVYATIVGGLVQLAVQMWTLSNIKGICTADQPDKFTCASTKVFGTASIIWGLIGPAKTFSIGRHYHTLTYGFLMGALAPIPFWLLAKKYPKSIWRYVNMPALFSSTGGIPPATGYMFIDRPLSDSLHNTCGSDVDLSLGPNTIISYPPHLPRRRPLPRYSSFSLCNIPAALTMISWTTAGGVTPLGRTRRMPTPYLTFNCPMVWRLLEHRRN